MAFFRYLVLAGVVAAAPVRSQAGKITLPSVQASPDDGWWGFGTFEEAGISAEARALTLFQGDLIAGGYFSVAGGQSVQMVARWDGERWYPLRGGVDHFPCPGLDCHAAVNALAADDSNLYVGGWFPSVDDGVPARYVARWDGARWHALGLGVDSLVTALVLYNGDLIAGGSFTHAGSLPANRIARWDGASWRPLGGGFDDDVFSLAVFQGELIASGRFRFSGGVPVNYIARWDGTIWSALGGGFTRPSAAGHVLFQNELVTNGALTPNLWQGVLSWNGAEWRPLGPSLNRLYWFAVYNDRLIGVGYEPSLNHIAEWTGSEWGPIGSGLNDNPDAVIVHDRSLFVGGYFTTAGGKVSHHIARWTDPTAVAVSDLKAEAAPRGIRLSWRLAAPGALRSVSVQRAPAVAGPYAVLAPPLAPEADMRFDDAGVEPGLAYWYRLLLAAADGSQSVSGAIRIDVPAGFSETKLFAPYLAGQTVQVRYRIGAPGSVWLRLYDVRGRLLRTFERGPKDPGEHVFVWDRAADTVPQAHGVYVIHLQADISRSQKLVLVSP